MRHRIAVTIAALSAAALIAACGGSSPPAGSGSSANNISFKQLTTDAYRQSACMRSHGVSNFPDPRVVNQPGRQGVGISTQGLDTHSPTFKAAQRACAHLMPGSQGPNQHVGPSAAQVHRRQQALLALAQCMRGRGFPRFPDPNSQGNIAPQTLTQAGIDIRQPAFVSAAESCAAVTHGVVTAAQIRRAITLGSGGGSQHAAGAAGPGDSVTSSSG